MPREHLLVEMEYIDRRNRLSPLAWAMAEAGGRPSWPWPPRSPTASWSSRSGPASAPACTPSRPPAAGPWPTAVPARVLASLQGPRIRWRPPVLEIGMPGTVEMELGGRGIALVPSVFVGREPSQHENPNHEDEMPRLILPAEDARSARLWAPSRSRGSALAALRWPEPGGGTAECRGRVHHH